MLGKVDSGANSWSIYNFGYSSFSFSYAVVTFVYFVGASFLLKFSACYLTQFEMLPVVEKEMTMA